MAGISGIYGRSDTVLVEKMLKRIRHRGGPGDEITRGKNFALGRKAASTSEKNMGGGKIVIDGVFYEGRGREVTPENLLTEAEPPEHNLSLLNGMFAIALVGEEGLLLARDPLGVKPLYYGKSEGAIVFASELKALADICDRIEALPPGSFYAPDNGPRPYYTLPQSEDKLEDIESVRLALVEKLEQAVLRRLAGADVGSFLSGGLDSSLIAALAAQNSDKLHTFATGTKDSNDLPAAREVAEHIGSEHHERIYDVKEALKSLPEVIYHLESFDYALVRSSVANYFLAQTASEYVDAVLSGEGADELFAGYEYLKDFTPEDAEEELRTVIGTLHSTALQRNDRMGMAFGVQARIPFLDTELVEFAASIPMSMKQRGDEKIEKWILRRAADDLLPESITARKKAKFAVGSGLGGQMGAIADKAISDDEFEREREVPGAAACRNKEELMYYRIFRELFPRDNIAGMVERTRGM